MKDKLDGFDWITSVKHLSMAKDLWKYVATVHNKQSIKVNHMQKAFLVITSQLYLITSLKEVRDTLKDILREKL